MILDLPIRIHNFGADHRFLLTGCWNMDNCLRKMNDSSSKQENKIKKFDPQLMISACGWIFGFTLFSLVFSSWFCHLFPSHVLLVSCILLEKEKINHTNHGPENQIILEKEWFFLQLVLSLNCFLSFLLSLDQLLFLFLSLSNAFIFLEFNNYSNHGPILTS